jgi:tetratricopeptide (TPR) repeat protein
MARAQRFPSGGGFGGGSAASRQKHHSQLEQQAQRSLQAGDWEGAERSYRWLIRDDSVNPSVYKNLAALLAMQKCTSELEPLLRQAIALQPTDPVALNNLGQVLVHRGAVDEAEACFDAAVQLDDAYPQALTNLANLRFQRGALDEAIDLYQLALAADPNYVEAQWNLAHPLLLLGDYHQGLRQYEYRSAIREAIEPHAAPALQRWDGAPLLNGTPLVLVSEQGLGDSLQFMRLAPLLKQRQSCEVVFSIQDKLEPLARSSALADRYVPHARLAELHQGVWLPLLSLPIRLGIEPTQPLPSLPPLRPSALALQRWAERLAAAADQGPIRVGIHWQGDPAHEITSLRGRSLPLEALAPLAAIKELTLVSLQRGHGEEQLEDCSFRNRFTAAQADMNGVWAFDDMAAIVEQCDLVISSDSAIVHLAAGMGRPTWVLLKDIPEWRWGLHSSESFWYPSVRLFRQSVNGDWAGLIATVAANLKEQICTGAIPAC